MIYLNEIDMSELRQKISLALLLDSADSQSAYQIQLDGK
jgi:hypothetical protein